MFPHAMAFGAAGNLAYAEEFGRITAQESRALGVHWNLFPVADVNSNPANPIIGTRAFGAESAAGGRSGGGLYSRCASERDADHRQALSGSRQYRDRLAPGNRRWWMTICSGCVRWICLRSERRSKRESMRS